MPRMRSLKLALLGLTLLVPAATVAAPPFSGAAQPVTHDSAHGSPAIAAGRPDSAGALDAVRRAGKDSRGALDDSRQDVQVPQRRVHARRATLIAPVPSIGARWAIDDAPVRNGEESRSWIWGPQIIRSGLEPYAEAPGGTRAVWYLDKGRMEITDPDRDPDDAWYVTSGLLVRELISGAIQIGDRAIEQRAPADVPVAGDIDAPPDRTITYRDLAPLAALDNDRRAEPRLDAIIVESLANDGTVLQDERRAAYGARLAAYDEVTGHHIADVFAGALPADRLLYLAGRPLTEPYWATVPVDRVPTDVLLQAFERRVLTYTPRNPAGWQIEWGNVGRQYAQWRYGSAEDGAPLDPLVAFDGQIERRELAALSSVAARLAAAHPGLAGVAVLDLDHGALYAFGAQRFPMFSTAKVPIMLGVLHRAQRERRPIAAWEDALIRSMIQVSANEPATALITQIGGAAELNRYLRSIGLEATTMHRDSWGYSTTTPEDMARLMAMLANCSILNAELCRYALDVLRGVVPDQRWGITAGAPDGAAVAIKNGWSPERDGWTINSVGYVSGGRARYTIAVYTTANASRERGIEAIEAIAREVAAAFR